MVVHTLKLVLVALASFASNTDSFSSGAGSCGEGNTSIQNTVLGNTHVLGTSGTFADLGVSFSIGGTALVAGTPTSFPVGSDLQWSVDSTNTFKGIFVRVAASGDFTHIGDPVFLNDATTCAGISGVIGLDHVDTTAKTSVTGTTNFDAAGTATVDIVVVFTSASYAYSPFLLTLEQVAAPTEPPTGSPVAAPVVPPTGTPTGTPVVVPVVAPTETPVAAPVVAPTETPVAAPVVAPTEAPVIVPVVAPTETPVIVPVATPTDTPVTAPVEAPVVTPNKPPVDKPPKTGMKMGKKVKGKGKGKNDKKNGKGMKKRRNLRY